MKCALIPNRLPLAVLDNMSVKPTPPPSMFATSDQSLPAAQSSALAPSPEMEQILASLTSHRSVLGYLLLSRGHPVSIIRHSGVVFEGEQGRKYAHAVSRIVESVQAGLEEVSGDPSDTVSNPFSWHASMIFLPVPPGRGTLHAYPNEAP